MSDANQQTPAERRQPAPSSPTSRAPRPTSRRRAGTRRCRDIVGGNAMISMLAVVLALARRRDPDRRHRRERAGDRRATSSPGPATRFAADLGVGRPARTPRCSRARSTTSGADGFADGIRPLTETLTFATPLIAAGLGVGARLPRRPVQHRWPRPDAHRGRRRRLGRLRVRPAVRASTSSSPSSPASLGGAIWGGIVGLLKARTGAHEVIVTIMLNYVALLPDRRSCCAPRALLQAPGSNNPKTPPMLPTAVFPDAARPAVQPALRLHPRRSPRRSSSGGCSTARASASSSAPSARTRNAARVAGINVKNDLRLRDAASRAASSASPASARCSAPSPPASARASTPASASTRSPSRCSAARRPWGVFVAGILFGAFKAGGFSMQAAEGVPIDIVLVVQSLIVLFIAAPPLVRAIFRLPAPGVATAANSARSSRRRWRQSEHRHRARPVSHAAAGDRARQGRHRQLEGARSRSRIFTRHRASAASSSSARDGDTDLPAVDPTRRHPAARSSCCRRSPPASSSPCCSPR